MKTGHDSISRKRAAFSLTELLVAVVIAAAILALALPSYQKTRQAAKGIKCLGNLRTYGVGLLTYASEHSGLPWWDGKRPDTQTPGSTYPSFEYWVRPYVHLAFARRLRCPLMTPQYEPSHLFNYGGNSALCMYYPRLIGIPAPASRVVLAAETYSYDGFNHSVHLNMTMWGISETSAYGKRSDFAKDTSGRPPQYHGGERALNLFFLDGHAGPVHPTDGDWRKEPTYGTATNGGIFFEGNQFSRMQSNPIVR